MKYNFDEIVNRRGSNSVKWDLAAADVLPMWVADMDFKMAPEIIEALQKRLAHGIFGYTIISEEVYQAVIHWWLHEHQYKIQKENLLMTAGTVLSLSAIIRTFVKPTEKVLLQTPVYNHFFDTIKNCGSQIIENPLRYKDGSYHLDWEDLEKKTADPKVKLLLISNPHNPISRVYTLQELQRMAEICAKNHVMVISDEIHSDLIFDGYRHTPFMAAAEHIPVAALTCSSPCKTFNMSGLPIAYLISKNKNLLQQVKKTLEIQDTLYPNVMSMVALVAAYQNGKDWLEALKVYIFENYQYLRIFLQTELPDVKISSLEATYLVWLDCSSLKIPTNEISDRLLKEGKLWLNAGNMYGENGSRFLRINIACPRATLTEGLCRFSAFCKKY